MMARDLLQTPEPCVVAIGGFSGSGKTTLARALAPSIGAVPGALVVRSDDVRKRLCGVAPGTRLGAAGYAPDVTRRVYATLLERAAIVVRRGHSAVVDAVYAAVRSRGDRAGRRRGWCAVRRDLAGGA